MTAVEQESKYEIAGSDYRCQPCGAEIPCEAAYYSAVVLREGGFQRLNFCGDCWSGQAGARRAEVYAFWRTRRPPLPAAKPKRMRFDTELVFEFFRKLEGAPPGGGAPPPAPEPAAGAEPAPPAPPAVPDRDDLRFVLALLLVRKKILDLGSTVERDGAEWLRITTRREPREKFWIKNPGLNARKLDLIKEKVGELLQMQL